MITLEKQLATVAIALPPKKRARLAELIMKTLESRDEAAIAEAWHDEAYARSKAFAKGKIEAHPIDVALGIKL